MTSPNLPATVIEYFTQVLDAAGRGRLRSAQAAMSAVYRDGGHSSVAVPDATAALAYAVARMPATYAACVRAFDLTAQRWPDFQPANVLDLGAGPGTATLAAAAVWPGLMRAHMVEPSAALAAIAARVISAASTVQTRASALNLSALAVERDALPDLVVLSYVLAEQPEAHIASMVTRVAEHVGCLIVVVEPGTPAGYARVLQARDALIVAGLRIVAPCPHAETCPLPPSDWCHFSVRLQRSAAHMQLKEATVPFEDERFSFVAAVRGGTAVAAGARLLRPAAIEKGFADLALCTPSGLQTRRIRRRDAPDYKAAKNLTWGDEV